MQMFALARLACLPAVTSVRLLLPEEPERRFFKSGWLTRTCEHSHLTKRAFDPIPLGARAHARMSTRLRVAARAPFHGVTAARECSRAGGGSGQGDVHAHRRCHAQH
eukprot:1084640-Pleurochrysis_carterae.AAC.1